MTHPLKTALLAAALMLPSVAVAQETARYPEIRPEQYSLARLGLKGL